MGATPPGDLAALPDHVPVVIVGGGPSGLFLALDLAYRGVRSLVIETREHIDANRPRAKTTNARTMTHLRRLGLADTLRAASPLSLDYSECVIFCSSLTGFEVTRFEQAFQLSAARYGPQPEAGQQVPQPTVETVLREAVSASPLATLATGLTATAVVPGDEGERGIEVTDAAGATRRIHASYVVGADGSGSMVRRSLGIALSGSSAERSNLNVLFRAPQLGERVTLDPAVQYWVMAPGASGIVGRLDRDDTWWAIVQGVDPDRDDLDAQQLLAALVGEQLAFEVIETDPWTARMLLADGYGGDGVYLLGDAAHLNPPWGGHGFNTCIGDAANLSWKLAASLQGWAGEGLLDSYELERRPVAARTIHDAGLNGTALAYHFADGLLGEDSPAGAEARRLVREALEVKSSEFHSLGLVLGYQYPASPLVVGDGTPAPHEDPIEYTPSAHPGSLLPHAWLADARSVYDLLGPGFTLLVDADAMGAGALAQLPLVSGAAERHGIPLRIVLLGSSGEAALEAGQSAASLWQAAAVLVRPDEHVAWRGYAPAGAATALAIGVGGAATIEPEGSLTDVSA
ncbi:FAD-dependent monooxygenase [Microbacterium sp. STN6]|uniref:FAD-dependent monooxygenase n=1 Tax=Microbacterium sp. STN6 TaxID=2995588 RepID=UPI002260874E|nr:FAD-dependent monooxygenase [Microbacterium sp. STN6]MCX7520776.1 FAD-dependent monooxygenase [Microbacterium sp. STN6]